MSKSYRQFKAAKQPDQTACWSTTLAWWTRVVSGVPNLREIDILGMYSHLTGTDGGIKFPDGFRTMLKDSKWGLTVVSSMECMMIGKIIEDGDKKGPILCGYWDDAVSGYHAVALYGFKDDSEWFLDGHIWAMDPNMGMHIKRQLSYYLPFYGPTAILGYRESIK